MQICPIFEIKNLGAMRKFLKLLKTIL